VKPQGGFTPDRLTLHLAMIQHTVTERKAVPGLFLGAGGFGICRQNERQAWSSIKVRWRGAKLTREKGWFKKGASGGE